MLIPFGWLAAIAFRLRPGIGPVMGLATAYANVGFFGVPVTLLAFGADYLIYQSVLAALMATLTCTVGVWMLAPPGGNRFAKLRTVFETPLIPSVLLGLTLRGFEVEIPALLSQPIQFLGSIFTLLTLIIAVPSAVKIFNYVTTLWKGNIRFTPGMLFSIGLVSFFLTGGITGIFLGSTGRSVTLASTARS